jgi:ABC-type polysaccharide/polyol phosphate export permease
MNSSQVIHTYNSEASVSLLKFLLETIREIKVYRFALVNFVINNLRMRYRRSTLGFLWSLLNPLLVMVVISVVFSVIFHQDLKTFSVFIFSGLAPWWFMSNAIIGGCQSLINAEGFLKKVYLPKVLFPLITVTTETVNFFFTIISLYILALLFGFQVSWTIVLLPLAVLAAYIFNAGITIMVGVVTVYFRDLSQILLVVFQALFYLVPIVYPIEAIPEQYRRLFLFNPFYYFIMLFRKVIYGDATLAFSDWLMPFALAIAALAAGLILIKKQDRDLIFRL